MRTTKIVTYIILFSILTSTSLSAPVIEEGFFINGIAGVLKKEANEDTWTFAPDKAIEITDKITFPAGESLQLLPCSVLEQMIGLAGKENQLSVELSALFTEYRHKNYLFSVSFLPIQDGAGQPEPEATEETPDKAEEDEATQEEPVEESIIPTDILKQIKSKKTPDLKKFQQIAKVTGDTNLIGRAGYFSKNKKTHSFQPDAFGMKVNKKEFVLLPNSMLAAAEKQMAGIPGKQRYNVSGLVTTYKGQTYILLRRASRTYTNGNFTP